MKFTLGALVAIPALLLISPVVRANETVPLSSLDLSRATQGFGVPQQDKSVDGHILTLKGQTFAHGFGTHSPSLLVIDLNGGAKHFTATVGIDDEVPAGKGSAEFEVLDAAHKIMWRSGILRRGDVPKKVEIDLTGLKQIALRVTTAGDGFEFDHADWADAKFDMTSGRPQTIKLTGSDPVISLMPEPPAPKIHTPFVVSFRTGTPLTWRVPVTGNRPLTFSAAGLPRALTLEAETGTITGTVSSPGDYSVRMRVKNGAGHDEKTVHLLVGENLAATPSLGWNSYDCFGDDVTEAEVLANARYVAENMQPVGWDTIVVDYRWYDPGASTAPNNTGARAGAALTMDLNGRLLPSPNRFPSAANGQGFKGLADQVHAMGLKFGIHIMRGIPRNAVKADTLVEGSSFKASQAGNTADTCPWCPDMYGVRGSTAAGQAYYDSIFKLYASWGIDYVKMDDTSSPYHSDEIEAVHNAIMKCGRSIVYSLSPGETPLEKAKHVEAHANLWRVSGDFWDDWTALDHEFLLGTRWHDFAAPGHWPDADMLPVGHLSIANRSVGKDRHTNFSKSEQVTLISLWSMLPSPLMVGANLPDNDPWTKALLTNPDVLAINQDALAAPGTPMSQTDDVEIWAKKMADGSLAVGLFNRSAFDQSITADWSALGLKGRYSVRNLWERKEMGRFTGKYEATVPGHGTVLLRLTRALELHREIAAPLQFTGVNISGGEFDHPKPGVTSRYGTNYIYPAPEQFDYFAGKGMNIVRLPFHWENLQHEQNQSLNQEDLDRLKGVIAAATGKGLTVILDPHNYARFYDKVIGSPDLSKGAFADLWSRIAAAFKDNKRVWFGLMNEPHDMPIENWFDAANASIAAIRKTGAKNMILVPGTSWTGAHSWIASGNASAMLQIKDPQNHFLVEAHQYLDSDSSGTHPEVVSATVGSERLKQFTLWCREHHIHGFLGEFGAGEGALSATAINDMLAYMEANRDVWTGFTWWSAGPWFGDYMFTLEPKNGQDRPQMIYLKHHLQVKPAGK